ncbi:hypothetical protein [Flexithrix dorotheae]|uniref:hypothetical protein n=1 Tax=Flexithrix dorotheae TaxID=70993 RepID=UPI0003757C33|nr:hypothetical protein [Flexithrix dorotheae]
MKKKKRKKIDPNQLPKVHKDLKGFDIKINEFGEIKSTLPLEEINKFLNRKVVDKKLKDRLGYKSDEDDDTVDFLYDDSDS